RRNQTQTAWMAAFSDKRCVGPIPSVLGAKSAYPAPYRPTNTKKLSHGSLRAPRHVIIAPMTNPSNCVPGFVVDDDPPPATKPDEKTIILRGVRVPLASDVGGAFVTDCARNRERLFSDDQLQEKYDIRPADWTEIIKNKPLRL